MAETWSTFGYQSFGTATGTTHGSDQNAYIFESDGTTVNAFHGYSACALMTKDSSTTYWDCWVQWWSEDYATTGYQRINYTSGKYSYQPKCIWISPHELLVIYAVRDEGTKCKVYNVDTDTLSHGETSTGYSIEYLGTNSWSYLQGHGGVYHDEFGITTVSIGTRNSSGLGITLVAMHYPEDSWSTWTLTTVKTGTLQFYNTTTLIRRKGYLWMPTVTTYSGNYAKLTVFKKAVSADPGTTWTQVHETAELPYSEVSNKYKVTSMSATLIPPRFDETSGVDEKGAILVDCNKWYSSSNSINYRPMMCLIEMDTDDESVLSVTSEYITDSPGGSDDFGMYREHVIADESGGAMVIGYTPNTWGPADGKARVRGFHNPNVRDTTWFSLSNTGGYDIGPIEAGVYEPNHVAFFNPESRADGNTQGSRVYPQVDPFSSSAAASGYGLGHISRKKVVTLNVYDTTRGLMRLVNSSGPQSDPDGTPALLGAKQQCVSYGKAWKTITFYIAEVDATNWYFNLSAVEGDTNVYRKLEAAWIRIAVWVDGDEPTQTGKPYIDLTNVAVETGWINGFESSEEMPGLLKEGEAYIVRIFVADAMQMPKMDSGTGGVSFHEQAETAAII
jgi:hypothetical protein